MIDLVWMRAVAHMSDLKRGMGLWGEVGITPHAVITVTTIAVRWSAQTWPAALVAPA